MGIREPGQKRKEKFWTQASIAPSPSDTNSARRTARGQRLPEEGSRTAGCSQFQTKHLPTSSLGTTQLRVPFTPQPINWKNLWSNFQHRKIGAAGNLTESVSCEMF